MSQGVLPPTILHQRSDHAFDVLAADILAEKASSLGHQGRKMERALAALRAHDAAAGDAEARHRLLRAAAHEVWAFFIQRELCGFRDHKQVIGDYAIPGEVLVRLGAM